MGITQVLILILRMIRGQMLQRGLPPDQRLIIQEFGKIGKRFVYPRIYAPGRE